MFFPVKIVFMKKQLIQPAIQIAQGLFLAIMTVLQYRPERLFPICHADYFTMCVLKGQDLITQ